MVILISLIIFTISVLGIGVILLKKIPILVELEEESARSLVSKIDSEVREGFKRISFEKYLHRILSKIRVLSLKTDNRTSNWLQKLRQKSQERVNNFSDDYWKKVKGKNKD